MNKLDLGCGKRPRDGFVGIDLIGSENVIRWNLENGLPTHIIKNDSVDYVWADNFLEHVTNLIFLMNSIHNAMKVGGIFAIRVPLANTVGSLKDPTHVRQFVPESFDYFDINWSYQNQPDYGIKKWIVESVEIEVESEDYKYIKAILKKPE